ncbi:MAG: hypothetical protein FJ214_00945 [Ignavibacteria bacterium]|nr:hypothetical protein [Ignavibacteria bacterium]
MLRFDKMNCDELNPEILSVKFKFEKLFGNSKPPHFIIAPASLIILGDHTHYNDGILISTALNKYTTVVIRKREDQLINIFDCNLNLSVNFSLNEINAQNSNLLKQIIGLIKILHEKNYINIGFDCLVYSDVPECLGLGRLVSYDVSFASAINKTFNLKLDNSELAKLIFENELNYIGKISNIAHIYTSFYEKENRFMNIDLRTLQYKTFDMFKNNIELIIINTKEKIDGIENICKERIEECEIGTKGLRLYIWGIKNLRDVEQEFLLRHYHMLPKRIFDRVLFNVNERIRTEKALKLIKSSKMEEFGKILIESHWSLAYDYQLSSDKLNYLVETASNIKGVFGSKMICCSPYRSTFTLVKRESTKIFLNTIRKKYNEKYNADLETFVFKPTEGVMEIPAKSIN